MVEAGSWYTWNMDKDIIQNAADEVGKRIGKLQGKLFAAKTKAQALEAEIQHLDLVYQSFLGQLKVPPKQEHVAVPSRTEVYNILTKLPMLDPSSQRTCDAVAKLLDCQNTPGGLDFKTTTQAAVAQMESYGWKQGEAIALAQRVVQHLRSQ